LVLELDYLYSIPMDKNTNNVLPISIDL